ncbi:hypothetical protein PM082_023382 [Marasmius tenuissimus]|nr:hypothetical protein PM082_023382 [Marasmius tenuissimus]
MALGTRSSLPTISQTFRSVLNHRNNMDRRRLCQRAPPHPVSVVCGRPCRRFEPCNSGDGAHRTNSRGFVEDLYKGIKHVVADPPILVLGAGDGRFACDPRRETRASRYKDTRYFDPKGNYLPDKRPKHAKQGTQTNQTTTTMCPCWRGNREDGGNPCAQGGQARAEHC